MNLRVMKIDLYVLNSNIFLKKNQLSILTMQSRFPDNKENPNLFVDYCFDIKSSQTALKIETKKGHWNNYSWFGTKTTMARPSSLLPTYNLLLTTKKKKFTSCVRNNTATKHPRKQLATMKRTKNILVRPKNMQTRSAGRKWECREQSEL